MHRGGAAAVSHAFEQQRGGGADHAHEGEETKVVDVSEQVCLPHQCLVNRAVRLLLR